MTRLQDSRGVKRIPQPQVLHLKEEPCTMFKDLSDSLTISHVSVERPTNAFLTGALTATHSGTPTQFTHAEKPALDGSGLWQMLETLGMGFCVSGISRVFTHQLVRARIGITFFQQCTGDQDQRHARALVPRIFQRDAETINDFIFSVLTAKMAYARALDNGMPVQEARYILPHCLETFIFVHANLAALSQLYQRRICAMTNTWEMVMFARQLKTAVLSVYPEARPLFEPSACEAGSCFFQLNKYSGKNTPWWEPDKLHDTFQWVSEDFVHGPHENICDRPPVMKPVYYIGMKRKLIQ